MRWQAVLETAGGKPNSFWIVPVGEPFARPMIARTVRVEGMAEAAALLAAAPSIVEAAEDLLRSVDITGPQGIGAGQYAPLREAVTLARTPVPMTPSSPQPAPRRLNLIVELFGPGATLPGDCLPDYFDDPCKAIEAGLAEVARVAAIPPQERDPTTDFAVRFAIRVCPDDEAGATRSFRTEFPDFDPATMPPLPAGWDDLSWRNDACPLFFNRRARLALGVEYANADLRTTPGAPRYNLCRVGVHSDGEPDLGGAEHELILASDDWDAILASIAAQPTLDPKALAAEAFSLAIRRLQDLLGVRTGDLAALFWSGREAQVLSLFEAYARAEQSSATPNGRP